MDEALSRVLAKIGATDVRSVVVRKPTATGGSTLAYARIQEDSAAAGGWVAVCSDRMTGITEQEALLLINRGATDGTRARSQT